MSRELIDIDAFSLLQLASIYCRIQIQLKAWGNILYIPMPEDISIEWNMIIPLYKPMMGAECPLILTMKVSGIPNGLCERQQLPFIRISIANKEIVNECLFLTWNSPTATWDWDKTVLFDAIGRLLDQATGAA